ncbi:MAG TPA: asparaginase domain-containing protein [Elusimicrobiales bacterium]|nr:asparaginase domain-containing protein [Elusimicrobiales bacterium]
MAIRIIITGGTFDKEYNELSGELFFKNTHLHEMLRLGRCKLPVKTTQLMLVDSLFMKPSDRKKVLETCNKCSEKKLVITHGTDTMEITARYLGAKIKDKTIILTGAMVPYKFGSSDGMFNLGSALSFAQCLPCGVYVAMNGKIFSYKNVRKNKKSGIFEEK